MRPFAAVERFFERVFERPSARLFHARLQPIQLQRRVERAMENGRLSASDRVVVPNRYLVRLAPADMQAFGDFADSLELELADAALKFARAHRYTVSDRPAVRLHADPAIDAGDARVDASFSDSPFADDPQPDSSAFRSYIPPPDIPPPGSWGQRPAEEVTAEPPDTATPQAADPTLEPPDHVPPAIPLPGPAMAADAAPRMRPGPTAAGDGPPSRPAPPRAPASAPASAAGIRADGHPRGAGDGPTPIPAPPPVMSAPPPPQQPRSAPPVPPAPPSAPQPPPPPSAPVGSGAPVRPGTSAGLSRLDPTRTMIFDIPTVDAPQVVLRQVAADGSQRQLTLDGGPVTIGRATDNNLVLNDSRVSRYHGRLAARQGALVYRDLGSTNGSRVNGVEIDEVVLGAGDRLELGDTVLVVESVAGS